MEVIRKGSKPTDCPSCGAVNVPSNHMRGLALPGQEVVWDCSTCREVREACSDGTPEDEKVLWGCQWCSHEEFVHRAKSERLYCSENCYHGAVEAGAHDRLYS